MISFAFAQDMHFSISMKDIKQFHSFGSQRSLMGILEDSEMVNLAGTSAFKYILFCAISIECSCS